MGKARRWGVTAACEWTGSLTWTAMTWSAFSSLSRVARQVKNAEQLPVPADVADIAAVSLCAGNIRVNQKNHKLPFSG